MTPTTPTLTIAELARFIGQQVQVGDNPKQRGKLVRLDRISCWVGYPNGHTGEHWYRDVAIRPVLRPVSALTDAEARECFWRAFDTKRNLDDVWQEDQEYGLSIQDEHAEIRIRYSDGYMCAELCGESTVFNAPAVVDYLDQQGIDCRGYLERKLAVEKPAERENQ